MLYRQAVQLTSRLKDVLVPTFFVLSGSDLARSSACELQKENRSVVSSDILRTQQMVSSAVFSG